jgi:hypothetical protein
MRTRDIKRWEPIHDDMTRRYAIGQSYATIAAAVGRSVSMVKAAIRSPSGQQRLTNLRDRMDEAVVQAAAIPHLLEIERQLRRIAS